MAKLLFGSISLLLLQAITALAAPNGSPTSAQPALRLPGTPLAIVTAHPVASIVGQGDGQHFQADLKKRAISLPSLPGTAASASSSLLIANSFTSAGNSSSAPSTTSGPVVIAMGAFTAVDGGVYSATSQNGYVVIDGKTLLPGQGALIGNEEVSEGVSGLVANGVTVPLSASTITPVTTTSAVAMTTSSAASGTATGSQGSGTVIAAGSTVATVSSAAAGSSSSAAAAAPTQMAGHAVVAVAGGLAGLLLL